MPSTFELKHTSAASPPRSPSDRFDDRSPAPSPCQQFRSAPTASHGINETRLRQRARKTFAGAVSKTAPAGEINCLDSAGFGAVTITRALTIACEGVIGSVL